MLLPTPPFEPLTMYTGFPILPPQISLSSSITVNVPFFAATVFTGAALVFAGAAGAVFASGFSWASSRIPPRALLVLLPGFRYCRAVEIVMPRPTPLRSSSTVSRVCPAASASLAFPRSFANASLREYLSLRGQRRHCNSFIQCRDGSLEHCLSDYFSLCHQVPPGDFLATRTICKIAREESEEKCRNAFIYRVMSSYSNE